MAICCIINIIFWMSALFITCEIAYVMVLWCNTYAVSVIISPDRQRSHWSMSARQRYYWSAWPVTSFNLHLAHKMAAQVVKSYKIII